MPPMSEAVDGHVGAVAPYTVHPRYPDPSIQVLDPAFARYRIFSASVERLATGLRWAEGPVWFGDGQHLLVSDIPNDRILRWDAVTGRTSAWRTPSNHANGLVRDRQGRLLACEHGGRRVTRTEYDGTITVLAEHWEGRRLNSPNDIVCASDGSIWFTDPVFGIAGNYEGERAESETPAAVYRIDGATGRLSRVIDDLAGPNGLCFSPDEKTLYVVESRATPHRLIHAYPVGAKGRLGLRRLHVDADGPGAFDGIKCDVDGNLWCGFGSSGTPDADPQALDGVMVYGPGGGLIGRIALPERCANLCFGGRRNNRLFMAASHSIYALYVETRGAI